MGYTLEINKQVQKKLKSLDKPTQLRIIDKLNDLGYNPDDPSLDIKKMVGESSYRLRVGDWRIIFEREDVLRIISVEKLNSRGSIYQ
jgi:mRNA interferase RelE/StbE